MSKKVKLEVFLNIDKDITIDEPMIKRSVGLLGEVDSYNLIEDFENSTSITPAEPNKSPQSILEISEFINNANKIYYGNLSIEQRAHVALAIFKYSNFEQFEKLPQVFGGKNSFKTLLNEMKKINFPLETIQSFYFFESRRWDLVTTKNALIKLPTKNYNKSLINYLELNNKTGFEKYKIFDYRIQDQLILK